MKEIKGVWTNNKQKLNRCSKRLFIYHILVLFWAHQEVFSERCPKHCACFFSVQVQQNSAQCHVDNSSVYLNWDKYENGVILKMTCAGTNYACSDMPLFEIDSILVMLEMRSCLPSAYKCVYNIQPMLSTIHNVKLIDTAGPYTYDTLTVIDARWLFNLWIIDNDERRLPAGVFGGLSTLKYLEVQGTIIEHLTADIFTGLPTLNELHLNNNQLKSIDTDGFAGVKALQRLLIHRNMLLILTNTFLFSFNNLSEISIMDNQANMTLDSYAFANLPRWISTVNLSNCKLSSIPEEVFSNSYFLKNLYFPNNSIKILPRKIFWPVPYLIDLSFRNNLIEILPENVFDSLQYLRIMDFSYNNIMNLTGGLFAFNIKLKEVYLNNNNIHSIDLKIFKKTYLQALSVASNKLQHIVGYNSMSRKLMYLNLSDNDLSEFEDWFMELKDLQYLDLSYNKINKIEERHIFSPSSWDFIQIDLRNNSISHIERNVSEVRTSVATGKKISVYLSNNPLECDCALVTILKHWNDCGWLADYKEIICTNGFKLSNIDVLIECEPIQQSYIASIGIRVMCVLILIIAVTLIFTRQQQIWRYISEYINNCKTQNSVTDDRQDVIKQYDLFISFAYKDGEFVIDKLLPKLEYEYGQKVCVHYRDWIVGELIPDQIVQSVECSRKTIIILTKHFLLSEWAYLEFRAAHDLSMREGKPRLIMILLDERVCKDKNLHKDIKAYISLNTYLVWDDPKFWEKLQKVLPRHVKSN